LTEVDDREKIFAETEIYFPYRVRLSDLDLTAGKYELKISNDISYDYNKGESIDTAYFYFRLY